jgi:hypothetical protein
VTGANSDPTQRWTECESRTNSGSVRWTTPKRNGIMLLADVVTYGEETGPNDIDVSPQIHSALTLAGYTFDGRQWSNT